MIEASAVNQKSAELDTLSVNILRTLSLNAVQAADSGHPGAPMTITSVAQLLRNDIMRFDAEDFVRPNRDRFVLADNPARARRSKS